MGIAMFKKTLIYISVEGSIQHWYPIQAIREHENCYRIVDMNPDPEHFYLQFAFDEIVLCEEHKFAEGEFGLVARGKCQHKSMVK